MTDENKEKATVAIANSILGQITLSDVLQLVQGNVLQQAKNHVDGLGDEELEKLIDTLDSPPENAEEESEEELQVAGDEK